MPLPLLVPIAMGAAGLVGASKATKAVIDNKKAKDLNLKARDIVSNAEKCLEASREESKTILEKLGKKKLESLEKELDRFVVTFSRLNNVEIDSKGFNPNQSLTSDKNTPVSIIEDLNFLVEGSKGLLAGAAGGALIAYGAYSGTMLLAASGTATPISALSGAAATNATLAWLGGGTLASGGMGIAGGTMVLGTLVTGPALLIFGSVLGAKATKNLNDAKSNLELAKTFESETKVACNKLDGIRELGILSLSMLSKVRGRLRRATKKLEEIQTEAGFDYSVYNDSQKDVVMLALKYAQLLKVLIDTPILDEDGNAIEESKINMNAMQTKLS